MGKQSKKYPEYTDGSVVVNGRTVATSTKDKNNNVISASYNMSDIEKRIYDSVQRGMNSSLNNLFSVSDAQRKEWGNQINALKDKGIEEINNIYTPMENNLKNDVAKRFGNLNNSVFLDNLNSITDKKSKAVADLNSNLLAIQSDLYTQELQNRINTLTLLSNLNSVMNNNILAYTGLANTNSNAGNTYNNNAYNATASSSSGLSSIFGGIGSTAKSMLSFI